MPMNALLLSNSTMPGTPFFTWPKPHVQPFLEQRQIKSGIFIPFAAVTLTFDVYEEKVTEAFRDIGVAVTSIHRQEDPASAIARAELIIVGGGNSFALLARLQENRMLNLIREKVLSGTPYIGWSAGANLACPTIMTTNDMPVVQPQTLEALGLIPYQINPHYHELKFEDQGGETRKERLEEFIVMNPHRKVIGLPEGMLLECADGAITLKGRGIAKRYVFGRAVEDLKEGAVL